MRGKSRLMAIKGPASELESKMKAWIIAGLLTLGLPSAATAKLYPIPDDENPVATITLPDGWDADDLDDGIEVSHPTIPFISPPKHSVCSTRKPRRPRRSSSSIRKASRSTRVRGRKTNSPSMGSRRSSSASRAAKRMGRRRQVHRCHGRRREGADGYLLGFRQRR
jgi:hypothetical protein